MIDCTKTENFLNEKKRMCAETVCEKCGIGIYKGNVWCREYCEANPQEAIKIVQKWSNAHSENKTLLDDFKEKHPDAPMNEDGTPKICPSFLGYDSLRDCPEDADGESVDRITCWSRPYKECEQK